MVSDGELWMDALERVEKRQRYHWVTTQMQRGTVPKAVRVAVVTPMINLTKSGPTTYMVKYGSRVVTLDEPTMRNPLYVENRLTLFIVFVVAWGVVGGLGWYFWPN